jgi:hypothetical protein
VRGLLVIGALVAGLAIAIGVAVSRGQGDDGTSPRATVASEVGTGVAATPATVGAAIGTPVPPTPSVDPSIPLLHPANPTWAALTEGLARTRDYYSETHTIDVFTIRWRPGAFPPEKAADVAALARTALDYDNALLGLSDPGPIEILLADEMYAQECLGCQGFAAADLRQVFILQDGSVADDELQALLTHEIAHVLAANYIALPESLFFAEGLAMWAMSEDIAAAGYVTPLQTAAWAMQAGILPPLAELREGDFAGRMRARLQYDPAGAFTIFAVQTYGLDAYKALYSLDPPEEVLGKTWDQLEAEWHAWLAQYANVTFNGVGGEEWWRAAQVVIDGYNTLYTDPVAVTQEQYAYLATSRLLLNRGDLDNALALAATSGLTTRTAQ